MSDADANVFFVDGVGHVKCVVHYQRARVLDVGQRWAGGCEQDVGAWCAARKRALDIGADLVARALGTARKAQWRAVFDDPERPIPVDPVVREGQHKRVFGRRKVSG